MKHNTKAMWFLFFQDRSASLNFLLCIFCKQQQGQLCSGDVSVLGWGFASLCLTLDRVLQFNATQKQLCGLAVSAINWLPQYLINLPSETSSPYVTFALHSVAESGISIKRQKRATWRKQNHTSSKTQPQEGVLAL